MRKLLQDALIIIFTAVFANEYLLIAWFYSCHFTCVTYHSPGNGKNQSIHKS